MRDESFCSWGYNLSQVRLIKTFGKLKDKALETIKANEPYDSSQNSLIPTLLGVLQP